MTDTLTPVERTNWALSAWNSTLDWNDVPSAWLYGQDHLWATQDLVCSLGCILFNRLLNPVLLNKSGLVRAKAGNYNLKSLNRRFSNYYQVRTWRVFAEPVTYRMYSNILRVCKILCEYSVYLLLITPCAIAYYISQ